MVTVLPLMLMSDVPVLGLLFGHVELVIVTNPDPPEVVFCGAGQEAGMRTVTLEPSPKSLPVPLGVVNVKVNDWVVSAGTLDGVTVMAPAPSATASVNVAFALNPESVPVAVNSSVVPRRS